MTRILVVEDERVVRNLMAEILEAAGYDVVTASSAEEAMELVRKDEALSLVITDVVMHGLSGLELLSFIRARRAGLPVVVATAAGTYEHLTQALAGGADGFLTKPFSHSELKAAAASALDRARRRASELRDRLLTPSIATALADAIETRGADAPGHCERVARLGTRIARALALDGNQIEATRLAAILHDVGKVAVPDRVLLKGEPFSSEEVELMREHPSTGARLLEPLDLLPDVASGVRHHHERWDGGGYPDGLAGDDIPLTARIVAVADAVDAMSTRRDGRDRPTADDVLVALAAGRETKWDPRVADAVAALIHGGELQFGPDGLELREPPPEREDREPYSVLLVEDDANHATLAIETLENELDDVRVVHVPDVASASELCSGATWSLALLDYQLPDGTGMELLERLRGVAPDLPIVMLTGSESYAVEAFRKGASDYVVKGHGYLDELAARVRLLIASTP